jgi:hypothetical protein
MTETTRIAYKQQLTDWLEKEVIGKRFCRISDYLGE